MNIYAKIYDEVATNLQHAGKKFNYEKTTFLYDIGNLPNVIDVAKYLELDNKEFFQAVFVAAYKRLPESGELQRWYAQIDLPREQFQKAFLGYVAGSSVVAINHMELVNNPYFLQKKGLKYKAIGALYGLTNKSSLREFGKRLPAPVQKVIRKVFL